MNPLSKIVQPVDTLFKTMANGINDSLSTPINYTQAPAAIPTKIQSSPITTPSGLHASSVPLTWLPHIQAVYKQYPTMPKGLLEATLHQESGMGQNDVNYNPQIGESAWLAGLTAVAKEELTKHGLKPDFDSQAGVIHAVGDYLNLIKDRHDKTGKVVNTITDPVELYNGYYKTDSGLKLSKKQLDQFRNLINYYAQAHPSPIGTQ